MDLKTYIATGENTAGGTKALAEHLGVGPTDVSNAKAGRRGLPDYACVILARLIGEDPIRVIAASELVTEKKEERRKVWLPFVQEIASNAASKGARNGVISIL